MLNMYCIRDPTYDSERRAFTSSLYIQHRNGSGSIINFLGFDRNLNQSFSKHAPVQLFLRGGLWSAIVLWKLRILETNGHDYNLFVQERRCSASRRRRFASSNSTAFTRSCRSFNGPKRRSEQDSYMLKSGERTATSRKFK